MSLDLCERVNFTPYPIVRNGRAGIAMVSTRPVRATPTGGSGVGNCKHICAELALHLGTNRLRVAIESCQTQSVSDFAAHRAEEDDPNPRAAIVSPGHAVICGSVTIWTTGTFCTPYRDTGTPRECGDCDPGTYEYDIPCLGQCACYSSEAQFACLYCFSSPDTASCTIEQDSPRPCGAAGGPHGPGTAAPGATIIPNEGAWDVHGDDSPFYAAEGASGLVRYMVKPFSGAVHPLLLDSGLFQSQCSVWLCHHTQSYTALSGWQITCNAPLRHPFGQPWPDEATPRPFGFTPHPDGAFAYVHFSFDRETANCFVNHDWYCLTDGGGAGGQWWGHVSEGDNRLALLDHLSIDFNCLVASDATKFPHREPECVQIANDALSQIGDHIGQIGYCGGQGHQRSHNYNSPSLNTWEHDGPLVDCWWTSPRDRCLHAPLLRQANGSRWTVHVQPHGTSCMFPADLTLARLRMHLRLSGDPGVNLTGGGEDNRGQLRVPATFMLRVDLWPRLRVGWENIACPVAVELIGDDPCSFTLDPDRYAVYASDGCSEVPLGIYWRGMNGPRPWSRSPFNYIEPPCPLPGCCDFLQAIDGLVIPGEVNDTGDPDSPQRFGGDVVISLNMNPDSVGCGC